MTDLARVSTEPAGEATLAAVSGEIDVSNAERIGRLLLEAVPNTSTGLAVDLRELGYIDSSGIRTLFDLLERLERRGQRLALVALETANVSRVLELTGVSSSTPVVASVEEALAAVGR